MVWKAFAVAVAIAFAVVAAVGAGVAVSRYITKIDTHMGIKDVTDFFEGE